MDKFKNWLILGLSLAVVILLLVSQCNPSKPKETFLKGKETIKYDTIKAPYKVVEFKTKYYPKWDSVKKTDTLWNASLCAFERTYNDSTVDSNITIYSKIQTIGLLKSIKLDYRWKKPEILTTISRTDTLVRPSRFSIYTGLSVEGNTSSLNLSPFLGINYKRVYVGGEYGLLDKTIRIKMGLRLFKSKK